MDQRERFLLHEAGEALLPFLVEHHLRTGVRCRRAGLRRWAGLRRCRAPCLRPWRGCWRGWSRRGAVRRLRGRCGTCRPRTSRTAGTGRAGGAPPRCGRCASRASRPSGPPPRSGRPAAGPARPGLRDLLITTCTACTAARLLDQSPHLPTGHPRPPAPPNRLRSSPSGGLEPDLERDSSPPDPGRPSERRAAPTTAVPGPACCPRAGLPARPSPGGAAPGRPPEGAATGSPG